MHKKQIQGLQQVKIRIAHSKLKSGTEFPTYIKELRHPGKILVTGGSTENSGKNNNKTAAPAKNEQMPIADKTSATEFTADLRAHQQVKTGYMTF